MKTVWLRKEGAEELLLFFNGWGMDRRIADYLLAESLSDGFASDLLLCYDYSSLEPGPGLIDEVSRYGRITLTVALLGISPEIVLQKCFTIIF